MQRNLSAFGLTGPVECLRPEGEFEQQHSATREVQLTATNTVIPNGMKQNIHQCKSEYSKT